MLCQIARSRHGGAEHRYLNGIAKPTVRHITLNYINCTHRSVRGSLKRSLADELSETTSLIFSSVQLGRRNGVSKRILTYIN